MYNNTYTRDNKQQIYMAHTNLTDSIEHLEEDAKLLAIIGMFFTLVVFAGVFAGVLTLVADYIILYADLI